MTGLDTKPAAAYVDEPGARAGSRAAPSVPSTQLGLLGGFSLSTDGALIELPVHAQRLLAFLALTDRANRVLTAGTLWSDVNEQRALGNLRSTVWRIQRLCPGALSVSRSVLMLAPEVQVDVRECWAVVGGAAVELSVTDLAAGRFCGELLPGWYEDWVIAERDRLQHLRLLTLERAAERLLRLGRHQEALDAALAVSRSDPLRESARRLVLRAHVAEDNRVEALRHFQSYRDLLATELGTEPSPRTWALLFSPS
jgi:DNA-binding SARP family transcriptional activator